MAEYSLYFWKLGTKQYRHKAGLKMEEFCLKIRRVSSFRFGFDILDTPYVTYGIASFGWNLNGTPSLSDRGFHRTLTRTKNCSLCPGYNKWKPGDENLDSIQYQVGSKTNKSLKWDFTGCSERRTESKTIVRLMEVWIRIKPEEETKMLLQNTIQNSDQSIILI